MIVLIGLYSECIDTAVYLWKINLTNTNPQNTPMEKNVEHYMQLIRQFKLFAPKVVVEMSLELLLLSVSKTSFQVGFIFLLHASYYDLKLPFVLTSFLFLSLHISF